MKINNIRNTINKLTKGFTLIELLVVVLIIGVLAAIAVTQYKKSVLKSKYATLLPLTKSLYDSQEMFDLTRGHYTDDLSDLELPNGENISGDTATVNGNTFTIGNNDRHIYIKATKEGLNNNYVMYQSKSKYFPNEIHCEAKTDDSLANWLCEGELGGTKLDRALTEGYTDYVIRGTGNGFFPVDWINENGISNNSLNISNGDTCTGTENETCKLLNVTNGSNCYGNAYGACIYNKFNNASCEANAYAGCNLSTYTNSSCYAGSSSIDACSDTTFTDSVCESVGKSSCHQAKYYGNSSCLGNSDAACYNSTFEGNSTCVGNTATACQGATLKGNAICYANVEGACGTWSDSGGTYETTYQDDACCSGTYCPESAPKCNNN